VSFDEAIRHLLENCPGARGAAIVDPDGIAVVVSPQDAALETLGAELATALRGLAEAARELEHGDLEQLAVFAEEAVILLTTISAGYFLVLVLARGGLSGRARFLCRLTCSRLYSEFI
jgi:predicted regulator of Ras-like GTPase activity (Roadblock/LC7/MglB family)